MKILLTVHQFLPQFAAGTEILVYSVARELVERGHQVHILTGHPAGKDMSEHERFDEYELEGLHVYRFHHAYTPMAGQVSLLELDYDNRLAAGYFSKLLQELRPDIVHFFHLNRLGTRLIQLAAQQGIPAFMTPTDFWAVCPTGQLMLTDGTLCDGPSAHAGNCVKHFAQNRHGGLVAAAAGAVPTVVIDRLAYLTKRDVLPSYPYRGEVAAISNRLNINISRMNELKGVFSPTRFMSEVLMRHGLNPHLVIQAEYGIGIARQEPSEPCNTMERPLQIGFIGTLVEHKGCHVLVEAFKALPAGRAQLKIYGSLEDFPDYAERLQKSAGEEHAIMFCGTFPNAEIGRILADLDVLVIPSIWHENTPLVLYSARAASCPVVASDVAGISEAVHDEEDGLLFQTGSVDALTTQLSRLVNDGDLLGRLKTNARQPKSTALYVDELLTAWRERS